MSTATNTAARPEPTAIEPQRVLVLNDDEQRLLLDVLGQFHGEPFGALRNRIAYGEEYWNAKDELTRVTLRKRRLEAEVRRCNQAIDRCEDIVVEEFAAEGESGAKHAATGASLVMQRKVWAKLEVDVDGLPKDEAERLRAEVKARAGQALIEAGMGEFVRPDFNLNTLSAVFREEIRAYDEAQRDLPEHKRVPRDAESFLPDELRGLIRIDDKPTISVRS